MDEHLNFSEKSDEEILQIVENTESSKVDKVLTYNIIIADAFFVEVIVGKSNSISFSEPEEILEYLKDYRSLGVELFYYKPPPSKEELEVDPFEFSVPDGTKHRIEFNIHCFPHIAINPSMDEQFKDQIWASNFYRYATSFGYRKRVDTHTLCDILRYCDKMARLKMFW